MKRGLPFGYKLGSALQAADLPKNWWEKYVRTQIISENKNPVKPAQTNNREPFHEWDFDPTIHEAPICQHFTCNKILSLREQLFGDLCIKHQPQKEIYL